MIASAQSSAREPAVQHIDSPERRAHMPRWVGIVFPLAALGGVALVHLYRVNRSWLDITIAFGGSAGLGLALGLAARLSLPHRSAWVRWLVALGGLVVSLSLAGILSSGQMGLRPLVPASAWVRWAEFIQLAIGGLCAWLAVRAYPRPESVETISEADPPNWGFTYHPAVNDTQPVWAGRPERQRRTPRIPRPRPAPATARAAVVITPGPLRRSYDHLRVRLARAASWRPRRSSPIRFTGAAEDRCPYCLDIVNDHDRRGVTTCPVCHTRHHAECWDVTGTCQIAHLYAGGTRAASASTPQEHRGRGSRRPGAAR
jgi:hypothetical protein